MLVGVSVKLLFRLSVCFIDVCCSVLVFSRPVETSRILCCFNQLTILFKYLFLEGDSLHNPLHALVHGFAENKDIASDGRI